MSHPTSDSVEARQAISSLSSSLRLESISVSYGGAGTVVKELSLDIDNGELIALLGESGCGKSTTLRSIAGLVQPISGSIWFGDREVTTLPPWKREVGLVFQNHALFPHLTVEDNVAYGLRRRRVPKTEQVRRVREALELVRMSGFERRRPHELSGGQAQRVALARALVVRPRVLLLDEPFSGLDAGLREQMQMEVGRLVRSVGTTTILVTHDQDEAMTMGDRVAVLRAGRILEVADPQQLYRRPRHSYTASFVGGSNILAGDLALQRDVAVIRIGNTEVARWNGANPLAPGATYAMALKPEQILVGTGDLDADYTFPAELVSRSYAGASETALWRIGELGNIELKSRHPGDQGSYPQAGMIGWNRDDSVPVIVDEAPRPE